MTYKTAAAFMGVLAMALLATVFAAPAHATWSLVWSDELNGASLNTSDWNYDIGTGCPDRRSAES